MPPAHSSSTSDGGSPSLVTDTHFEEMKSHPTHDNSNSLQMVHSHFSGHDIPVTDTSFREADAEVYLRFSPARKVVILTVLSICSFLAPISSTTVLSALPEVAENFYTTTSVLNGSNALYMAFMGIAAPFWGPFSQIWGRRPVSSSLAYHCLYTNSIRRYFWLPDVCSWCSVSLLHWPQISPRSMSFGFSLPSKESPSW